MRKLFALLLILILALPSLMVLELVNAETTPVTPTFTIKIVNHSYPTPPKPSTDAFTGTQTTIPGRDYYWQTLDLTVPNEKYTGQTSNEYGHFSGFLYFVRYKGNYIQNWTEETAINNFYFAQNSTQDHTVLSFVINQAFESLGNFNGVPSDYVTPHSISLPTDGVVDFQVKAMIGNLDQQITFGRPLMFTGNESGWSGTQTITLAGGVITEISSAPAVTQPTPLATISQIPTPTASPSQTPTASPIQDNTGAGLLSWEQVAIIGLVGVVVVLLVAVVVLWGKRRPANV